MSEMLPSVSGGTALEMADKVTATFGAPEYIGALPEELYQFISKRFVIPSTNLQPDMPLMDASEAFRVTYMKKIMPLTKDPTYMGEEQKPGTVIGKSPFPRPFPFIIMLAWTTRQYGYWDEKNNEMVVFCESRDGIAPSLVNDWGCLTCKSCPHHPSNRPKWVDDQNKGERCKQKIHVIGIGGDWRDIYVLQVAGQGIINFYSDQIGKELSAAKDMGEPYFMRTFMMDTERDQRGNPQYKIVGVKPTLRREELPESAEVMWEFDKDIREERNKLAYVTLESVQKLCMKYRDEFQEAGRATLKADQALHNSLTEPQGEETDDDTGKTAGDMELT